MSKTEKMRNRRRKQSSQGCDGQTRQQKSYRRGEARERIRWTDKTRVNTVCHSSKEDLVTQ